MLMDFQNAVCGPQGVLGTQSGASRHAAERQVLRRAADTLRRARVTDDLIVHVRVAFDRARLRRINRSAAFTAFENRGILVDGEEGAAFCAQVAPEASELVITKGSVSPFAGTGLDEILRAHGVCNLLMAGVATNFVVESAARYAGDVGYDVEILEDLCAAHSEELHRFAITRILPTFARITTSDEAYPVTITR